MLFNIIIIFAILQLGYNLLFKPKNNILGCGLFGVASDDVNKISIDKLKILGIFNDVRGGHSCGLGIDGDIIYGVDKQKLFKDLIATNYIDAPQQFPVVLGHTRMATGGTHNEYNAHPFGFGENRSYFKFMGTHNGTLQNHSDLAKKYEIDMSEEVKETTTKTFNRIKIDSEILLEIIFKTNSFKVLEEYEGAAALAMYNTKKKNVLYLYHGASKKYRSDKDMTEERPLFYLQAGDGLLYYSSIKESLEAINDTDGTIAALDCNYVYEIKNGNIETAKKFKINRSEAAQIRLTTSKNNYSTYGSYGYGDEEYDWTDTRKTKFRGHTPALTTGKRNYVMTSLSDHKEWFEATYPDEAKGIYFENLRFWKNKELLEGIFVVNKKHEIIHVTDYPSAFDYYFKAVNEKHKISDLKHQIVLYFIKGIRLLDEKDYVIAKDNYANWSAERMSHMSMYPVRDLSSIASKSYFRGELANVEFIPTYGRHIIKMRNGFSHTITERDPSYDKNEKFYLQEDLDMFTLVLENETSEATKVELEKPSNTVDDKTAIDLYNENITATVQYCIDDVEDSIENKGLINKIKKSLEKIKDYVTETLTQ